MRLRLDLTIQSNESYAESLAKEIQDIYQTPVAKKRYNHIIKRLANSMARTKNQAVTKSNENKNFKEISAKLNEMIRLAKLNPEQKLPKELIKEITEKEYPDVTKLKKIVEELSKKSAPYFPIKQETASPQEKQKVQEVHTRHEKINDYQR